MNAPQNSAGFYVTGFLDLLGTKERMQQVQAGETNEEKALRLLKFAKQVQHFREDFVRILESAAGVEAKYDKSCSQEMQARREGLKGHPVNIHSFSDTVVIHSLLAITDRKIPLSSVWVVLVAAAASTLFSLVRGVPIRGGIEIEMATELVPGEIFGPAIVEAICLEQKADWPRVLIGIKLSRWISDIASGSCNNDEALLNQQFAKLCQDLLCPDPTGATMLNLKSSIIGMLIDDHQDCLRRAAEFAATQYKHYCVLGNSKLAGRYAVLANYLKTPIEES